MPPVGPPRLEQRGPGRTSRDSHPSGAGLGSGGVAQGTAGHQVERPDLGLVSSILDFFFLSKKKKKKNFFFKALKIDGLGIKKKKKN